MLLHLFAVVGVFVTLTSFGRVDSDVLYFAKAKASSAKERTKIAEKGIAIDRVLSDSVTFIATESDLERLKKAKIEVEFEILPERLRDFPSGDSAFHNYKETVQELDRIATKYPTISQRFSIGKSLQGRTLEGIRISSVKIADSVPTVVFVGCHHAREHLSVEIPLKIANFLAENYNRSSQVRSLLDNREVWIVPMVNPDGAEYDIESGSYKYWRKNRRDNGDGTVGVDLNRNYGPKEFFGGPGSSSTTSSDTYHGPSAFSEPETQAVRDFLRARNKATTMITFHTFSELVLWPYGHTDSNIANSEAVKVFETMGKKMASWNGYTPEKASDLYLASGDTTDWAYEELKLFAFTFELTPASMFEGGFYPGAQAIEPTFKANIEPILYMIDLADDPYRVLKSEDADPLNLL